MALFEIARVMTYGAVKYSPNNWRLGFKYSRIIAAILRHIMQYSSGQKLDAETGVSHLAHACCGLFMLIEFDNTGVGEDDLYRINSKGISNMSRG